MLSSSLFSLPGKKRFILGHVGLENTFFFPRWAISILAKIWYLSFAFLKKILLSGDLQDEG
jgi:hypothetical protein